MASLLCFTYYGMRIGGVGHLSSYPHKLDHTKHSAYFHVNLIGQNSLLRDKKMPCSSVSIPSIAIIYKSIRVIHAHLLF